jgi:hypothetical protein
MTDNHDTIIAETLSSDDAEKLRQALMGNFARMWVLVYPRAEGYAVGVMSYWGGRLPEEVITQASDLAKRLVVPQPPPPAVNKVETN